jgi:hypothetical protein
MLAQDDLPQGTELLKNNTFDDSLNNWDLFCLEASRADYELDTNSVITGKNCVHIIVHNPYGDIPSGRIQLNQHNIPGGIVKGKQYYVSFNLKVNKDIEKGFWSLYKEPDYKTYYNWDWIKAKKGEVQNFSYMFEGKETDESIYFAIDLATLQNNDVELWIDDIHFIAMPEPIVEHPLPIYANELIMNNYFNDNLNNWQLAANDGDASLALDSRYILEEKYSAHVKVNKTYDSDSQKIRLYQDDLKDSVRAGSQYLVQFIAKANKTVSHIYWTVSRQDDPQNILFTKEFSLTADKVVFVVDTINTFASDEKVSWSFDLATISQDSVDIWFDGVHFMQLLEAPKTVFPPETTWEAVPPVEMERPEYLKTLRDPQYGVDYTCVSDPAAFGVSSGSSILRSNYPKIQAWNADMSLITLNFGYFLLNGDDYTIYKKSGNYYNERRWSNVDPDIAYFCSGSSFKKYNVKSGQETTLHTFSGYSATIGPWEGSISADDKYVIITNESGGVAKNAALYDIEGDSVVSTKSFSDDIDWVSVTPSGNYIVVNNRGANKIEVYDLKFNYLRTVGVGSQHGDFGIDSEGNEVWIQVIPLSMARLSDGKFTRLLEPNIGGHISGRGFGNPGWALVSTDINNEFSYATQLFEIKLDGSGIIRHFGYARSSCTTYDNYPFGSVSRDGKKVIFNSDWLYGTGSGGDAVAYISEYKKRTTGIEEVENNKISAMSFNLSQNYPNPFNPTTTIMFKLGKEGMTSLTIYNVLGQKVKVLLNEVLQAGIYSVPFNGEKLPSGIYFYKLQANNQIQVKKMLLAK